MGRKVQVRESYIRDALSIMRLRDAVPLDASLSFTQQQELLRNCTALIDSLIRIDNERSTSNVAKRNKKAG